MAQNEVVKSSLNIEELESSTKSLQELERRYGAFDLLLSGSQRLVRELDRADKTDRIYMLASLSFLATVVLWILWRRVFKAPVKLLLWSLLKLFGIVNFFIPSKTKEDLVSGTVSTTLSEAVFATASLVSESVVEILSEVVETLQISTVNEALLMSTVTETLQISTTISEISASVTETLDASTIDSLESTSTIQETSHTSTFHDIHDEL